MKIALSSSLSERSAMRVWKELIEAEGHEVTSLWIDSDVPDDSSLTEVEKSILSDDLIASISTADMMIVDSRLVTQSERGGRHVDFGIALACGYEILLIGTPENIHHYNRRVTQFPTIIAALQYIKEEVSNFLPTPNSPRE